VANKVDKKSDAEKKCLGNYSIVDCAILAEDYLGFIAQEDGNYDGWSSFPPLSVTTYDLLRESKFEEPWGCGKFEKNNFDRPKCVHAAPEELLIVDSGKIVYYDGLGEKRDYESPIPNEVISRSVYGLQNIQGTIYAVGQPRAVARRDGPNQWTLISQEAQQGVEALDGIKIGFDCINGFDQNDLYAGGGHSDLWHYDGTHWIPVDLPIANMRPRAISCAGDGQVYVVGRFGDIARGRGDHWEMLEHGVTTDDFSDAVWYRDRLYVATEHRLYQLKGDELSLVNFGDVEEIPFTFGHLYVNAGLLLSAGAYSAALYDGKQWKPLYGCTDAREQASVNAAASRLLEAEEKLGEVGEVIDEMLKNPPKPGQ
jgi:hypothetical protein